MSASEPRPAELQHPTIGTVRGNHADGVLQFLGVRYASIGHWFDNPTLSSYDGSGITATKYG
jgi:carboxylesterase type B